MRKAYVPAILLVLLSPGLDTGLRPVRGQSKSKGDREAVSTILEARTGKRFVPGEIIVKHKPGAAARFSADQVGQLAAVRTTSGGETVYRISPGIMGELSAEGQRDRTSGASPSYLRSRSRIT